MMPAFSLRFLPDNPVLTKELRVRMRGARAYWILFGYLGFLAAVLLVSYYGFLQSVQTSGSGGSEAARLGGTLFNYILVTQIFLVLFITPAITSGSITIENEQRTMEMLVMTRLSRRSIIVGKLLSAVSFTTLLLISSLPLISICFMFGSIDPGMVLSTYLLLLMGSFLIGALGLMWSSIAKTTTTAVMFTYISLFFLSIFVFVIYSASQSQFGGGVSADVVRSLGQTWFGDQLLGFHVPQYFGFAFLSGLGGLLLAAIAMTQLGTKFERERQAALLRGLTVLLACLQVFAIDLEWLRGWYMRGAQTVQSAISAPIAALIGTAMLLMFLTPIFATGELASFEAHRFSKYLVGGWTRRGLSRAKMSSGLPFLMLLSLLLLGVFCLAFAAVGKAQSVFSTARQAASLRKPAAPPPNFRLGRRGTGMVPPGATSMPPTSPTAAPDAGDFPQAALAILVSVAGFALLCMFLSIAFRSRWVAWLLASLLLLVLWILPQVGRASITTDNPNPVYINLFYLDPVQAIDQMAEPDNYFVSRPMALGDTPMWKVTTCSWLLIGVCATIFMQPFVWREKKRNTPIPYEELVASA